MYPMKFEVDTTGFEPAYFECKLRTAYQFSQRARGSLSGATGKLFTREAHVCKKKFKFGVHTEKTMIDLD